MMRAAIYVRVSSADQRERHTIESQLHVLRPFVEAHGWPLVGTYVDDGRSAKTGQLEKREDFARLTRDAESRCFEVVVVVDVDRLARTESMEERARTLGPFQRAGVKIATPTGGELDLRTFLGELYVTMMALVGAEENRKRAERVRAGKLRAIAEGRKPHGPTPYGLVYTRATGTWAIDPTRAEVVREIYRRVIDGESCYAIADDLHARGAPSPRGPWTRPRVWVLIRSRHTTGTWTADKHRHLDVAVPAILDEATWSAAQQALIAHGKRGLRQTRHIYLLEGLGRCGLCGSPMSIRSATASATAAAYVCRGRKLARRGERRCTAAIAPVADVDARVWAGIGGVLEDPSIIDRMRLRAAEHAADRRDWESDAAGYERRLEQLARAERTVLERFRRGLVTEAALDRELGAIAGDRAELRAQLDAARRGAQQAVAADAEAPEEWIAAIRRLAAGGAPEVRQRIVRRLVQPGAVFEGHSVHLMLRIGACNSGDLSGDRSSARSEHQSVTIRLVA